MALAPQQPEAKEKSRSREEQLTRLFLDQKRTLDIFLENGAISRAQYDKSLGDLKTKMGIHIQE